MNRGVLGAAIILLIIIGAGLYLYTSKNQTTPAKTIRAATLQGGISTLDIIEAYNLLEQRGYNLTVLRLQKTPDIIAALANNETDLAVIPAEMAGKLLESGADIRIIAVEMLQNQAIIVKDPNITSPTQLKGKLVGAVIASGTYKLFKAYMKIIYGIDVVEGGQASADAVTVVNIPPGSILDSLITGQVDAIVIWEPIVSKALAENCSILASYTDLWEKGGFEGEPVMLVWVARGEFAEKYPDVIKAFLDSRDEAVDLWREYKDRVSGVFSSLYKLDNSTFEKFYERTTPLLVRGPLTEAQVESIRQVWWLAWQGGYLKEDPASIGEEAFYHG